MTAFPSGLARSYLDFLLSFDYPLRVLTLLPTGDGWGGFLAHTIRLAAGGVPLSVVRPCLHGAMCHCHTQNKVTIRSKNGEAIIQCG